VARSISKRVRFEVFKRDGFACQYCGQTPPAVVLELDHIIAVADGGPDDFQNLITACFDCNRGKAAVPLSRRELAEDIETRRQLIQERVEQAEAYEQLLRERREQEDAAIDQVIAVYEQFVEGYTLLDKTRPSIRRFLRMLPPSEVIDAMEIAATRWAHKEINDTGRSPVFRYFCGVCWRKIKEG
jgi:hypothetical protein